MRNARSFAMLLALLLALCIPAAPACAQQSEEKDNPHVVTVYNESNGLPTGEANTVLQTSDGYIWIGSYGGLIRYDGSVFRNYSQEGALPSSSVRALFEDSTGRLWIGTNDAGVFYMMGDEIHPVENPTETSFLCIRDFAEGYGNTIYVASNSGMAMIYGELLTPCRGERIDGETVYSVAVDSYGRLWGALNSGLCAVVQDNEVLRIFESNDFLDGAEIYCTASDEDGNIYLGSSGDVLARLSFPTADIEDVAVERFVTEGVTTHNSIRVAGDGRIIVCGSRGVCVMDADGGQLSFGEADQAVSVNSAAIDYEGNIWLASTANGVIKYTTGYFETPNAQAGLSGIPFNAIVKQRGEYYLAADNGLLAFDENWNPIENALTELYAGTRVRSLLADSSGGVWVAAYAYTDPVARYDSADDSLQTFNAEDGLISTSARTLLELSDGSIALGTQEGLNVIRDGQIVRGLGFSDGLEVASVLCLLETRDGTILAGSDGGGIYEIDGDRVIPHAFSEGLSEGAVLRILADTDGGGYFVSAGSSLYYWDRAAFFKLTNIQKGPGSIFDFCLRDGKLWIFQNNGILAFDRAKLVAGENCIPVEYGSAHGLTGSLNANTWNWMDADGSLYMPTRSGVSIFRFHDVSNPLPRGIISDASVDGVSHPNPYELHMDSGASRLTLHFAALSYTDTTPIGIAYRLEGFDAEDTVRIGEKSGSISYTNLTGGEYTFHLSIFDPHAPDVRIERVLSVVKDKKLQEQPLLIAGLILLGLAAFAGIVALAVRANNRHIEARVKRYREIAEQSLRTIAQMIDATDPNGDCHSLRVAQDAAELARRMGKKKGEQEDVYSIALLHDIGKIGVPDSILNKDGALTDEERTVLLEHPIIGGAMLRNFSSIDGIADGAKYHHERYDGTGFWEHRRGTAIPETARIISIADACEVMRSQGRSRDQIIETLKDGSGTRFDPEIVPYMVEMILEWPDDAAN